MTQRSLNHYPTRRQFLLFSAAAVSSAALTNCAKNIGQNTAASGNSPSAAPANASGSNGEPLYLYAWADYVNDDLFKQFTEKTGIQVVADVYDSNETMLAKIQSGGASQYSIIYPSDYMVRQMTDMNLLTKLDHSRITGLDNLMQRWQSPIYDADNAHSVPYGWGTTGLIYNSEVINPGPEDWNFLWEHKDELNGKLTLLDDVRETMGAVLKSLGYSYNATKPEEIDAAYKKLLELKPSIAAFKTYGWEDQLISGDLAVAMTYSALGNLLPEENPKLIYVIPKSGTSVWTDTVAVPKSAPNLEAAYAWINFILQPENSKFATEKMKVPTPNQVAFDMLPAKLKDNTKMFPPQALLSKCDGIAPVGKALDLYDKYWTEVRSA